MLKKSFVQYLVIEYKIIKKICSLYVKFKHIIYVLRDSLSIKNKKVLFCDLGANIGNSYLFFKKFYKKNTTFFLFEPNVHCFKKLLQLTKQYRETLHLKNVAVSSVSGTFKFYGSLKSELSESGSISEDYVRACTFYSEKKIKRERETIFVKAINFNNFLKKNFKKFEKIVVKMDIEGAELNLIESLIKNKTLTMIDILYVEFHSNYVKDSQYMKFKNREQKIISYIKKTNIVLRKWI